MKMEPRAGVEPGSLPYQGSAQTAVLRKAMAENPGFEPDAGEGAIRLAGGGSDLAACVLQMAEGRRVDRHTLRCHLASNERREPSRLTFHGGERVRTMPKPCGPIPLQTGAGALAGSLSKLAEGRKIEFHALRHQPLSKRCPRPGGLAFRKMVGDEGLEPLITTLATSRTTFVLWPRMVETPGIEPGSPLCRSSSQPLAPPYVSIRGPTMT